MVDIEQLKTALAEKVGTAFLARAYELDPQKHRGRMPEPKGAQLILTVDEIEAGHTDRGATWAMEVGRLMAEYMHGSYFMPHVSWTLTPEALTTTVATREGWLPEEERRLTEHEKLPTSWAVLLEDDGLDDAQ